MTQIPEPTNTTAQLIYKLYEKQDTPRQYLGWSQIGKPCDRKLWLDFRNAVNDVIEPRIRRLFDTGNREETRILDELEKAGCKVERFDPKTGKQFAVLSHGGHFRGHADAIVTGLPEAPKTRHLVDVKTINVKKMDALLKAGMEKQYPEYWAQGHGYMGKMGLTRAMFIFVCKNDDRLHIERFDYDKYVFEKYENRAKKIIFSDRMPPPLSDDPTWYQCLYCSAKEFCHDTKMTKNVNCRTCANSTAMPDGTWHCSHYDATIPAESQAEGCTSHLLHPDLVPWTYEPFEHGVTWLTPWGKIQNGAGDANVYESAEIVANPQACALGVDAEFRREFDSRVVG